MNASANLRGDEAFRDPSLERPSSARPLSSGTVPVDEGFRLLLESLPDSAVWTLDREGRVSSWGPAAERLTGFAADEIRGKPFSTFYLPAEVEGGHPERALELAERLGRFEDEGLRLRSDGSAFWARLTVTVLREPSGDVKGYAVLTRDLTERRRSEQHRRQAAGRMHAELVAARFKLLADSARLFADAAPNVERTFEAVAQQVAESVGEACAVALANDEGQLRCAAVAHPDPDIRGRLRHWIEDGEAEDLPGRVFRSGAPLLFAAVRPDPRLAADPAVSGFRERVGASSLLLVPLRAREHVVGVLAVVRGEESPPYGAEDEVALQQLADLAALALENARLYAESRAARKRMEALAEEASKDRKWLEAVLDWLPTPLFLVEQGAHRVLYANRAADVLAGGVFPRGEDEESFCRQFACADVDGKPLTREQLPSVRASRGEEVHGYQMTWTLPSGTKSLLVNARLLRAGLGHPATAMVCVEDVTSLKRAQSELEEAIRVRDTFLSIAGHELKTPLTTLQLQIQSLGRMALSGRPMDVDKSVQKIEAAHRQTERLAVLIGQLLDVSRINAGRLRLDLQPVDLAALVRDVTERFNDEGERVGSELQVSAQGRWVGRWDRERLDQVLSNLLSNALKYGRGKPVEVWLEGDEHHARLHVRDHGIGIAPEDQARIFDRFERAVSDRHYGGLGLGLWIVREVVAALGGTIRVESTPGEGSLFTVELPVPVQR